MLRRAIPLVALVATPFILAPACSAELPIENLCGWLSDGNNCLSRFASDVGSRCGNDFVEGNDPIASATGTFLARDKLDICVKNLGGQVIFDPPLDVTTFPVTSVGFKMLDAFATECGSGSVANNLSFVITINPVDANDAGPAGPLPDDVTGGTYTSESPADRQAFDVTCPYGGETHHFNVLTFQKCPGSEKFLPEAIIDSSPGNPESANVPANPGYVRLRLVYPPDDPTAAGATPRVVEYFNCLIPPPPPPCQDTVQNGNETDIDCGGSCPAKCAQGQKCLDNVDCITGNCGFNGGFKQCL